MNEYLKKYLEIYYKAQELYMNGENNYNIKAIVSLNLDRISLSRTIELLNKDYIKDLLDDFDSYNI